MGGGGGSDNAWMFACARVYMSMCLHACTCMCVGVCCDYIHFPCVHLFVSILGQCSLSRLISKSLLVSLIYSLLVC